MNKVGEICNQLVFACLGGFMITIGLVNSTAYNLSITAWFVVGVGLFTGLALVVFIYVACIDYRRSVYRVKSEGFDEGGHA